MKKDDWIPNTNTVGVVNKYNEDEWNRFNFAMMGKLTPYGKNRGARGNKEGIKMMGKYAPHSYPKYLKTDKDKFIYLKDLLGRNEVSEAIFVDLATILNIKSRDDKIVESIEEHRLKFKPRLMF